MKRSNTQNISDVIKEYIKEMRIDTRIKEIKATHLWDEVVGKTIAGKTDNLYIKNKVLYVKVNSSIVKNELFMIKDGIVKAINEKMEDAVIEDVVFK
jgi:predicted nucleic acid-binding Zn ribbon protein